MARVPEDQILKGPIVKTLLLLGWPVMISNLLHSMYNIVDTFWLGKLGGIESTSAVAALQVSWPIIFLMIAIAFGFGSAGVALVSQYTGARKPEEANRSAGQVLSMSFVFGVTIAIFGFTFSHNIVEFLGIKDAIAEAAVTYLRIIFLGIPFMFTSMIFGFLMRAYGDMITPMKLEAATVCINMVLDPVLIFGLAGFPQMGIMGAAIATIFSRSVSSAFAVYILFSGRAGIKLEFPYLKPVQWRVSQIFAIGVPASVGNSGTALGFVVLMAIIARLPDQGSVLAGYGIANRLTNLMFIAIEGLGVGVATILGQSLGANNVNRAEEVAKKGMILMFLILVGASAFLYLGREFLIQIFIDNDAVIAEGSNFIRVFVFGMAFFGIFRAVNSSFMGSGHNMPTMILDLVRLWGLRIPLALVFGFTLGWGTSGVWFGMALSNVLGAVLALGLFKTGIWKKRVIKTA
ncbi:MAG: MATE family efflux transporter [Theionarchaea archaeon]|nr:MATE family efflux transporter [Theionarchaea archaeon]MBU7037889.1 MATE family efflux transporter [Theionarchaea archaeon]